MNMKMKEITKQEVLLANILNIMNHLLPVTNIVTMKEVIWGHYFSKFLAFSIAVMVVTGFAILHHSDLDLAGVATVITTALSFVFAIIKLMEVITKYCFPENDDEYIVKIIQEIQENDLEAAKEANRVAEVLRNKSQNTPNISTTIHIPKTKKKHRRR